ncbi:MAG: N-acetyltransferase family protein [Gaiellaceae bacterium]
MIRFRRVTPSEADELCAGLADIHLDALSVGMALGALDTMGRNALERWYHRVVAGLEDRRRVLLVAEEEDRLRGMAQLVFSGATNADHRAEVQRVGVATEARGRGIGRSLMAAVEEVAGEHHVTLLWLTTHADTGACAFYEALGYTRMGTMPNYSRRPDGTLWPGAFYFKELSA